MLHHEGISEQMFENAALSSHQLEDSDFGMKLHGYWSSWENRIRIGALGTFSRL
jgi:hypothetical protein